MGGGGGMAHSAQLEYCVKQGTGLVIVYYLKKWF